MSGVPPPLPSSSSERWRGLLRLCLDVTARHWLSVAVVLSLAAAVLNWNAAAMKGLLPFYEDFRDVILSGGDAAQATRGQSPTFPMWGYGFVMIVFRNQLSQVAAQLILALVSAWVFVGYLERNSQLGAGPLRFLKILLGLSLPYWAFHAVRWPYSFAASLLLLSLVLLDKGFHAPTRAFRYLVMSGALFGVILNLRSDFVLYPVLLAALLFGLAASGRRGLAFRRLAIWVVSVYLMMVPWMIHTSRVTGHPLLASTNGGHVLFLGLGQHPTNFWGIEPSDSDPLMHRIVESRFGKGFKTWQYESDQLLRQEFLSRIAANPWEYLVKCAFVFKSVLVSGSYGGEFWGSWRESRGEPVFVTGLYRQLAFSPWSAIREFGWEFVARLVLDLSSRGLSTLVVALGVMLAPMCLWVGWRQRHLIACVAGSVVLYQTALSCAAYHMLLYASNVYVPCLVVMALAWPVVAGLRSRSGPRASYGFR